MSLKKQSPAILRFGVFEADLRSGELRKQGARIKLQEQPFQVLKILLERPGEVVTREDLQSRLWLADTFVDFDNGLNTSINKLREALGDSSESPRFIETLPRRGYRFIASVGSNHQEALATGTAAVPGPQRQILARALATAGVVMVAVLVAAATYVFWGARSHMRRPHHRSPRWRFFHSRIFPVILIKSTSPMA